MTEHYCEPTQPMVAAIAVECTPVPYAARWTDNTPIEPRVDAGKHLPT